MAPSRLNGTRRTTNRKGGGMLRRAWVARALCIAGLTCIGGVTALTWRAQPSSATASYTIAFKSFAPNNTDIFIANGDGTRVRPLVPDPALDYNPSFSADGRWIIFTSQRSGPARIYRVHPDGSGLEPLTDGSSFADQ